MPASRRLTNWSCSSSANMGECVCFPDCRVCGRAWPLAIEEGSSGLVLRLAAMGDGANMVGRCSNCAEPVPMNAVPAAVSHTASGVDCISPSISCARTVTRRPHSHSDEVAQRKRSVEKLACPPIRGSIVEKMKYIASREREEELSVGFLARGGFFSNLYTFYNTLRFFDQTTSTKTLHSGHHVARCNTRSITSPTHPGVARGVCARARVVCVYTRTWSRAWVSEGGNPASFSCRARGFSCWQLPVHLGSRFPTARRPC